MTYTCFFAVERDIPLADVEAAVDVHLKRAVPAPAVAHTWPYW